MALINCPECGNMLSDKAPRCPHCGAPNHKPMNKKVLITTIAIITTCSVSIGAYYGLIIKPRQEFNEAHTMLMDGQVEEAYAKLQTMREETELQGILYQAAIHLTEQKQYDSAEQIIDKLGEHEGVKELKSDINFARAQEAIDAKDYDKALSLLRQDTSEEAENLKKEVNYERGTQYYDDGKYIEAIELLSPIKEFKEAKSMIDQASILSLPEQVKNMQLKNSDTVGWLYIPDSTANYAVMQSNNNSDYLKFDEQKHYSFEGSYFADYECNFGKSSEDLYRSTVIYGMNVYQADDGVDVADDISGYEDKVLDWFKYTDKNWAEERPYIYFSTPQEVLKWEVFCVAYTENFNYIRILENRNISNTTQLTTAQMMSIVNSQRAYSEYDYDVDVTENDKIITLSTCTYKYGRRDDDLRFIIMAKLVTDDDPVVERATISINTDKIRVK